MAENSNERHPVTVIKAKGNHNIRFGKVTVRGHFDRHIDAENNTDFVIGEYDARPGKSPERHEP